MEIDAARTICFTLVFERHNTNESGGTMYRKLREAARVAALAPLLTLAGCWDSDQQLIPDDQAADPFDGARYVIYNFEGHGDSLLERRAGKYPVFDMINPAIKDRYDVRFFEIGDSFSWFRSERYIARVHNGARYTYFYLERDDDDWTTFEMGGARPLVTSLEQLLAQVEQARSENKLRPGGSIVAAPIDASAAMALKQRLQSDHDREMRAAELAAREEAIRIREQQLLEEQRIRAQAQRERIAELEAEVAASRQGSAGPMSPTAPLAAVDDQEPSEDEMSEAVRNSTGVGVIFGISVTKLGGCRKKAPYDYVCRYRWVGVNWGNFWKEGGQWSFEILEGNP